MYVLVKNTIYNLYDEFIQIIKVKLSEYDFERNIEKYGERYI
ncbi:hypothetical protein [Clostridium ljungdahlii]|nr:hypothetical protein [Clostridium ljungdahlii]